MAAEWAARGHDGQRVEADAYRAHVDGIVLGQDPRQGFEWNGTFYHPDGGFRFPMPRGWEVVREGQRVRIAPRGATGLEVELGPRSRHPTAVAAAEEFIRENGLEAASSYRTTMNGFPGARVEGALGDGERPFHVSGYWMEHDGAVVRFAGISESEYAGALNEAIGVMTRGFRALDDEGIRSMQPVRLGWVTTETEEPFRAYVEEAELPSGMDLEALAILNGVGVDDLIPAGRVLKLPR
jgi:predicted Zn-dependent protease